MRPRVLDPWNLEQTERGRRARRYVFVGDTGELDGQAGELMLSRYPDLCAAVLLHCVGTDDAGRGVPEPNGYEVNGKPVRFFRTYPMAAYHAVQLGLIDEAAFERVCTAALRDLGDVPEDEDDRNQRADVVRDINRAREMLRSRRLP